LQYISIRQGLNVEGLDLSHYNIGFAKKFENDKLKFSVHDMRQPYGSCDFNYILNMFTSFGYFRTEAEDEAVINTAAKALKTGGKLVIDFLNPDKVVHNLVSNEIKEIGGIRFEINRKLINYTYIIKDISFFDHGKPYFFQERVRAIKKSQFLNYFKKANLNLLKVFGDYELNAFNSEKSNRMIFVLENKMEC